MSRDDQGQACASGRRVPVASLVLNGQAQARSPEASGKVSISVQRDQDQQDDRMEVIVEPKTMSPPAPLIAKTTFSQDSLY